MRAEASAITGTFKIRIVQPDQPTRETDMKRTAGADLKPPSRIGLENLPA